MTNEVYRSFIRDLSEFYGKKDVSVSFINECEEVLANVPNKNAKTLFKYIVRKSDFFPKLTEFSKLCVNFCEVKAQTATSESERCPYCLGSGLIPYRRKVKYLPYMAEYFASCTCPKGRTFYRNPVFGIEEVYGAKTQEVLGELLKRNSNGTPLEQSKQTFFENVSKIGIRNNSFSEVVS